MTHILRRRILSYLSANIHLTIHVRVHRRTTRLTDAQPTLHTIRVSLGLSVNGGAVFFRLVFEQVRESVKLPSVEFLVPTLAPIP
ncbi:MAG: hypothetical protein J07HQX50_00889 [Haloquadratum sp. J07HQX50]|nr:MAG: hypothetical protein J07HQX50_00889 [Haloquadratum sp. J07HQX50]